MTKDEKMLLLQQAKKLAALGIQVERERENLKRLVDRNVSYASSEMRAALERYDKFSLQWKRLEAQHLAFKKKLGK